MSNREQEQRIQNAFPSGEYSEQGISDAADALFGGLRTTRQNTLAATSYSFGTDLNNNRYPPLLLDFASLSGDPAASDAATESSDDLYESARNSYIFHKLPQSTRDSLLAAAGAGGAAAAGTPSTPVSPAPPPDSSVLMEFRDQSAEVEHLLRVAGADGLQALLTEEFRNRVQSKNLGSVENSEFDVTVSRWVPDRWDAAANPTTEEGVLYRAKNNFIWAYYSQYIQSGATRASNINIDDMYTAIDLDGMVDLYLDIKVRKLLLEADDSLEEERENDPPGNAGIIDAQGNYTAEGLELLRGRAQRQANERLNPSAAAEDVSAAEESRLRRLAEQAFLIDFLPEFAKKNQDGRAPDYDDLFWMVHGHTDTVLNKLLYNPALENLDILRPSEIAELVPHIRIYKEFQLEGGTTREEEVPFDSYLRAEEAASMLNSSYDRGRGVGLKSFDWSYTGRAPFADTRVITAELKLFFQSFDELLRYRNLATGATDHDTHPGWFRYTDLINIAGGAEATSSGENNRDSYKIRAEVGWADPGGENNFIGDAGAKKAKRDAIRASKTVLYLQADNHTLDISDEGTVNLSIHYIARQEAEFSLGDADILATEEIRRMRLERQAALKEARENCDTDAREQILQEFKRQLRPERHAAIQRLLNELYSQGNIFFVSVPVGDIETYINYGEGGANTRGVSTIFRQDAGTPSAAAIDGVDFSTPSSAQSPALTEALNIDVGGLAETDVLTRIQDLRYGGNGDDVNVQFFYFGDLVKVALEHISTTTTGGGASISGTLERNLRIILGPISFRRTIPSNSQGSSTTEFFYNINIADIPISVNYYVEWFLKYVVAKDRETYPILTFLRELSQTLLTSVMRDQAHGLTNVPRQNLMIRTNFLTAAANQGGTDALSDDRNIIQGASGFTRIDADATIGRTLETGTALMRPPRPNESSYNYMMLYAINSGTTQELTGDYWADRRRGIYHFGIGKDRGLFKRVKFIKTDLPYARESRLAAALEQRATGLIILKNVYNLDLSMVGNTLFIPGMKVYLDPSGISPILGNPQAPESVAKELGIGGYHVITEVRSYIESGKFETTIKAIFEGAGFQGALGISGTEDEAGGAECAAAAQPQSLTDSATPTQDAIQTGPEDVTFTREWSDNSLLHARGGGSVD